jgi:hypothetical protein
MFSYILNLFQSLERFLGFGNDYADADADDDAYEYWESNQIVLTVPITEQPIVSPTMVEPMLITSENTFVAKY